VSPINGNLKFLFFEAVELAVLDKAARPSNNGSILYSKRLFLNLAFFLRLAWSNHPPINMIKN
jgi:hypothetical protein